MRIGPLRDRLDLVTLPETVAQPQLAVFLQLQILLFHCSCPSRDIVESTCLFSGGHSLFQPVIGVEAVEMRHHRPGIIPRLIGIHELLADRIKLESHGRNGRKGRDSATRAACIFPVFETQRRNVHTRHRHGNLKLHILRGHHLRVHRTDLVDEVSAARLGLGKDRSEVNGADVVNDDVFHLDSSDRSQCIGHKTGDRAAECGVLGKDHHAIPAHLPFQYVCAEADVERCQRLVRGYVHEIRFHQLRFLDHHVDDADIAGPGVQSRNAVFLHSWQPAKRHVIDGAGDDEVDLFGLGKVLVGLDALGNVFAGVCCDQRNLLAHHPARCVELVDCDFGSAQGRKPGIRTERSDEADFDFGRRGCGDGSGANQRGAEDRNSSKHCVTSHGSGMATVYCIQKQTLSDKVNQNRPQQREKPNGCVLGMFPEKRQLELPVWPVQDAVGSSAS